jgi:hypothetical protein
VVTVLLEAFRLLLAAVLRLAQDRSRVVSETAA